MRFYRQKPLHSIGKVWNALSLHLQNDKLAFKWVIPFRVGLGLPTLATDKPQKPFHRPREWVKAKLDWPSSWWHVRQRAFPSRDALILVDRDVWTARRDSWANKAKCHVALALPGLADSSLWGEAVSYRQLCCSKTTTWTHMHQAGQWTPPSCSGVSTILCHPVICIFCVPIAPSPVLFRAKLGGRWRFFQAQALLTNGKGARPVQPHVMWQLRNLLQADHKYLQSE